MGTLSVFMSDLGKSLESAESGQLKTINQRLFYWQTGHRCCYKGCSCAPKGCNTKSIHNYEVDFTNLVSVIWAGYQVEHKRQRVLRWVWNFALFCTY